jgi:hypothetical protein
MNLDIQSIFLPNFNLIGLQILPPDGPLGRIKNAESGGKWLQSIIFHSRLIVGIGTDGRTKSPIIELSVIPMAWREMAGNPRNARKSQYPSRHHT